ncbi:MAG: alpha/beta hydrolase [Opitutaceae bacterium]|nr:alpha/beta hydrolase [Opitutaceae bacterium]
MPSLIRLWPGAAPGSEKLTIIEKITERSADPAKHDRITTQIVAPSLQVFRPPSPNGVGVIIAPGGGYQRVVIDKEGLDTATWLNGLGITAFVLKYRLPDEGHDNGHLVPLQDAQRAMRLVRAHAAEWELDPTRIGFLGYSAGGHLAASVAFFSERRTYEPVDDADALSARPDFSVFCYAVAQGFGNAATDTTAPQRARLLTELAIVPRPGVTCPPAFIFHASDDTTVPSEHALRLYRAVRDSGSPAELHVFRRGGHGFGIRNAQGPIARWPDLCEAWLRDTGVLR